MTDMYIDHCRYTSHVSVRTVGKQAGGSKKEGRWMSPRPDKFEGQKPPEGNSCRVPLGRAWQLTKIWERQ